MIDLEIVKNSTILIVDDDPTNLKVLHEALRQFGFKVLVTQNGIKIFDLLSHQKVDLILLDILMPEIDGLQICKMLKNSDEFNEIPVIFLSALGELSNKMEAFYLGAVDYITKPFKYEEVFIRVSTHLTVKKQYEELKRQKEQLINLNAAKDRFFSILAHDLRSPLVGLIQISDLLMSDYKDLCEDEKRFLIENIQNSAKGSFELLENLLNWSRLQIGHFPFEPQKLDLNELVRQTKLLYTNNANLKNIEIINNITEKSIVFADHSMLQIVFNNLIANAIKFSFKNSKIIIEGKIEKKFFILSVKDSGIGIAEKDFKKLFRIETKFSNKGTADEKGSGLGLILCKEFIEKNNGKVWVSSKENEGSTFFISLPLD